MGLNKIQYMSELKYKEGDRVLIKSIDWYNENKDENGYINCGSRAFFTKMSNWCGKILTIRLVVEEFEYYCVSECIFSFTDEMIEGLVEEEVGLVDKLSSRWVNEFSLPDGYIFKDENGNVINAMKIVLEKKEKEYPKTYEECCKVLDWNHRDYDRVGYKSELLCKLQVLLLCRDAYWKIAGEEMGLGKPWEPDYTEESWEQGSPIKYVIYYTGTNITKERKCTPSYILTFPTEEMRDAFYKNFKKEIEICKELL